jgi:hypothetical protein
MEASIVELRYKMNDVLRALERKEEVTVLYRGKVKGTIKPVQSCVQADALKHPFFGSEKGRRESIADEMEKLRGGRFGGL